MGKAESQHMPQSELSSANKNGSPAVPGPTHRVEADAASQMRSCKRPRSAAGPSQERMDAAEDIKLHIVKDDDDDDGDDPEVLAVRNSVRCPMLASVVKGTLSQAQIRDMQERLDRARTKRARRSQDRVVKREHSPIRVGDVHGGVIDLTED